MPKPEVRTTSSGPRSASAALFIRKNSPIRAPRVRRWSLPENTHASVKQKFQSVEPWVAITAETT